MLAHLAPHRPTRLRSLGLSFISAAVLCASANIAPAADDKALAAMDRLRYARSFDEIHDALAAAEAVKAGTRETSEPWTKADLAPPRMTTREVPDPAYRATVAYPSPGS